MKHLKFYTAGHSQALEYAVDYLKEKGCQFAPAPESAVTHLLLPCPAFDGVQLRGGANLENILAALPKDITVIGGKLSHPVLEGYKCLDLLQDDQYLAENAMLTAHCAVKRALQTLPVVLEGQPVLVVGWGRIGKCLAQLLRNMGARVTVAARKEGDRAMLRTLGYDASDFTQLDYSLVAFRVIFNTVPEMVLSKNALQYCHKDCLKIDLASRPGMEGSDIMVARGLPNLEVPESSGRLIAKTVLYLRGVLL